MMVESQDAVFEIIATSARAVLAIVFLSAGIPKAINGQGLANTLRSLGIERASHLVTLRFAVPIAEIMLGSWLLTGVYPQAASVATVMVLVVFTYVLMRLRKGEDTTCACFVWDDTTVGIGHVVRNLVLASLAVFIGTITLLGLYTWQPVWELPKQSALVVSACVLFVFLLYALVAKSFAFVFSLVES